MAHGRARALALHRHRRHRAAAGDGFRRRGARDRRRIDPLDPTNPFTSLRAGPTWWFAGTFHDAQQPTGYVAYRASGATLARVLPELLPAPIPTLTTEVWRAHLRTG
jgi:hypothetical protein